MSRFSAVLFLSFCMFLVLPSMVSATSWQWNEWVSESTDWGQDNAWLDDSDTIGTPPSLDSVLYLNRPTNAGASLSQTIRIRNNFHDAVQITPTGPILTGATLRPSQVHVNGADSNHNVEVLHNNYSVDIDDLYLGDIENQSGKAVYTYTPDGSDEYAAVEKSYTTITNTTLQHVQPDQQLTYTAETSFSYYRPTTKVKFVNETTVTFYDGSTATYAADTTVDFTPHKLITFPAGTEVIYPGVVQDLNTGETQTIGQYFYRVNATGTNTATLGNSRLLGIGTAHVGEYGRGELNIKEGSSDNLSIGKLWLGENSGSEGTVNLQHSVLGTVYRDNAGYVTAAQHPIDILVGINGTGVFNQTGGSVNTSLTLGFNSDSGAGTYTLSEDGFLYNGSNAYIGAQGTGTFIQDSGTFFVGDRLFVGNGSNAEGTYYLKNGNLTVDSKLTIGNQGKGTFIQTGGENLIGGKIYSNSGLRHGILELGCYFGTRHWDSATNIISYQAAGRGQYLLQAGTLNAAEEYIGLRHNTAAYGGYGEFIQTGGVNTVDTSLIIGHGNYFLGKSFYQLDNGTLNSNSLTALRSHSSFIQNGGTHNVGGTNNVGGLYLGDGTNIISSNYELNNGNLNALNIYLEGYFNQRGGINNVTETIFLKKAGQPGGSSTQYFSQYNLSGGMLDSGQVNIQDYSYFDQSAGTHTSQKISIENGTLNNGYYALSGGTLLVDQIVDNSANQDSFHFTGGTLSVNEFVGNLNMQGGTLASGHSPGATAVDGNFIMTGGILDFEIASLDAFDFMSITGNASFSSEGFLEFSFLDNFIPQAGDIFQFMTARNFNNFDLLNVSVLGLDSNLNWEILNGQEGSTAYRSIYFTEINNPDNPVPEPATLLLLGSGLAGLAFYRRKRK